MQALRRTNRNKGGSAPSHRTAIAKTTRGLQHAPKLALLLTVLVDLVADEQRGAQIQCKEPVLNRNFQTKGCSPSS